MGASNAEDAEFLEMAEYFDSLDAEDLDDLDDAEYADYLDYAEALEMAERKHGRAKVGLALRKGARKGGKKKPKSSILRKRDKLVAVGGGGTFAKPGTVNRNAPTFGSPSFINQMMTQSKGDLNITVTRESVNIASNLPLILFGLQGFQSSYNSIIKQYLPANTTLVASTDANNGDVLLTYTNSVGPLVDVIRISLTGSVGFAGGDEIGSRVGLTYAF